VENHSNVSRTNKSISKQTVALVIVALLGLVGSGVFGYLWFTQKSQVNEQHKRVASADSEVASLKKQLQDTQAKDSEKPETITDTAAASAVTSSENDSVTAMVQAYAHLPKGAETSKLDIKVTKQEIPFARATVMTEDGGYACVLKKSDTLWVVLYCGQDTPLQDQLDIWGVPPSMITS
jgi:cytoskeletal protein RodZ